MENRPLRILLANPRGFCAGVERAIGTVERALATFGRPVYVRHEIVHNQSVVRDLARRGAVFVDELDEVPDAFPVVFSAHGVSPAVVAQANARAMLCIDATCPLVSKVHREVKRHLAEGRCVVLVGHAGHPEVIGTMGQAGAGELFLVETEADARSVSPSNPGAVAVATQTTLSVDDTAAILAILRSRFPRLHEPRKGDICFATTNRQAAAKALAARCDAIVVLGASNSSNSNRLRETAEQTGVVRTAMIASSESLDWPWLDGVSTLGIISGASTPERLVEALIRECRARFRVTLEEVSVATETVEFKMPAMPGAAGTTRS